MTTARTQLELEPAAPLLVPNGFARRLRAAGVDLDDTILAKQGDYLGRLLAMNEQMNLTAVTDVAEAWERHIFDALTLVPLLADVPKGARLVDVGSGGGVPGIPLAIARPDLEVTLVESTQKKAAFLSAVSTALGLTRVTVRPERAETLGREPKLRGGFHVVTARAVANLAKLAPLTVPFARPGGKLLLVKGQRADEELALAKAVLAKLGAVHEKTIATPTGRIVVLRRLDA